MAKYVITIEERYKVEAESAEQALGSYRVKFDGCEPEMVGLTLDKVIHHHEFEYLDGKGNAEESDE
jgi:hypothetical protein